MTFRLTKKRKKILEVLKKHHGTLSASEVHRKLPDIDLVTIYRNLDLFVSEKLIKKVHLGTEEARYEYQTQPHHHAVCSNCKKVTHFAISEEKMKSLLPLTGFNIEEVEITVRGKCRHGN